MKLLLEEGSFKKYLVVHEELLPNSLNLVIGRFRIVKPLITGFSTDEIDKLLYNLLQKHPNPNTYNSYIFTLHMLRNYLEHNDIDVKGFRNVKSKKKKPREPLNTLTPLEIAKLIEAEPQYGVFRGKDITEVSNQLITGMLMLFVTTGARYASVAGLRVKDIDLPSRLITYHTKGDEYYRLKIPIVAIPFVEKHLSTNVWTGKKKSPDDLLFMSISGGQVCSQNFSWNLRKRAEMCGITKRVNPHGFRHAYGTEMRRNGMKIEDIARLLNHKDIQTTYEHYDHITAETLDYETIRHPIIREGAQAQDIFKLLKEAIASFHLDNDPRFSVTLTDEFLHVDLKRQ